MRSARFIGFPWRPRWAALALLAWLGVPAAAGQHDHGSGTGELELFVSSEALGASGRPHLRDDDSWVNADIVFGLTRDRFRVFGEYFVTSEEHDLERFEVGYEGVFFAAGTSSAGLMFVRATALSTRLRSTHADLQIYGSYVDWTAGAWHVLGAAYYGSAAALIGAVAADPTVVGYVWTRAVAHDGRIRVLRVV